VRLLFAALDDVTGVLAHRRGAFERISMLLDDWHDTRARLSDTQARMLAVLDELELTQLVTSITGLCALGAATILAQTGDLNRFATAGRWSSPGRRDPSGRAGQRADRRGPGPLTPALPQPGGTVRCTRRGRLPDQRPPGTGWRRQRLPERRCQSRGRAGHYGAPRHLHPATAAAPILLVRPQTARTA
jgi:hypothetical protein